MNAGQAAALIAAVFFAGGVCVAAYALVKLARLAGEATRYVTGARERADALLAEARSAIDRANEQLNRTDAITLNMNEVTANVAELTEHVSALTGLGRALAGGPVGKAAAVAYGIRRAVGLRRDGGRRAIAAQPVPAAAQPVSAAAQPVPAAGPARPGSRPMAARALGRLVR